MRSTYCCMPPASSVAANIEFPHSIYACAERYLTLNCDCTVLYCVYDLG